MTNFGKAEIVTVLSYFFATRFKFLAVLGLTNNPIETLFRVFLFLYFSSLTNHFAFEKHCLCKHVFGIWQETLKLELRLKFHYWH